MKLYWHPLSGHAHRVQLFLSLLGLPVELVEVDLFKGAHKAPEFLKLNRFGQVPLLDDGGHLVPDSNAILVYLAKKYGGGEWLPEDPAGAAAVQRWLSIAAGPIAFGPSAARAVNILKAPWNKQEVIDRSHKVLAVIDAELTDRSWIAAPRATIADLALYAYIARAPEGDVSLEGYPNVRAWLARIEALPGFVAFPKTPVGLPS